MDARSKTDSRKAWAIGAGAIALLIALLFAFAMLPGQASAEPNDEGKTIPVEEDINATPDELMDLALSDAEEVTGNTEDSTTTTTTSEGVGFMLGRDYVWAGNNHTISGTSVANDLLLAGRIIWANDMKIGGSIRAAGNTIEVTKAKVTENITLAGNNLTIKDVDANDVCMAANKSSFEGTCSALHIYGNMIYIDGTINGDVKAAGNMIDLGPNTKIKGTLYVTAPASPDIPDGAQVGNVVFTQGEPNGFYAFLGSDYDYAGLLTGVAAAMAFLVILISIIGTLIISILSEVFFKRHTAGAAKMISTRTGKTIATGIIGAIVAPIVLIILCVLIVTLPIAGALALALLALAIVSTGFMAASLFKLVFKKMGRYKVAILGGLIVGVLSAIPILGVIVAIIATVYTLGYVLQRIFLSMREEPEGERVVIEDLPSA